MAASTPLKMHQPSLFDPAAGFDDENIFVLLQMASAGYSHDQLSCEVRVNGASCSSAMTVARLNGGR